MTQTEAIPDLLFRAWLLLPVGGYLRLTTVECGLLAWGPCNCLRSSAPALSITSFQLTAPISIRKDRTAGRESKHSVRVRNSESWALNTSPNTSATFNMPMSWPLDWYTSTIHFSRHTRVLTNQSHQLGIPASAVGGLSKKYVKSGERASWPIIVERWRYTDSQVLELFSSTHPLLKYCSLIINLSFSVLLAHFTNQLSGSPFPPPGHNFLKWLSLPFPPPQLRTPHDTDIMPMYVICT